MAIGKAMLRRHVLRKGTKSVMDRRMVSDPSKGQTTLTVRHADNSLSVVTTALALEIPTRLEQRHSVQCVKVCNTFLVEIALHRDSRRRKAIIRRIDVALGNEYSLSDPLNMDNLGCGVFHVVAKGDKFKALETIVAENCDVVKMREKF